MKKASALMFTFVWPIIAWAQVETDYTVAEAASMARLLMAEANNLHDRVSDICNDAQATGLLYEAAEAAVRHMSSWSGHHKNSQTLATYHACRQSMLDVQSHAYSCANGGYKGKASDYMSRRWLEDSANCADAIGRSDPPLIDAAR